MSTIYHWIKFAFSTLMLPSWSLNLLCVRSLWHTWLLCSVNNPEANEIKTWFILFLLRKKFLLVLHFSLLPFLPLCSPSTLSRNFYSQAENLRFGVFGDLFSLSLPPLPSLFSPQLCWCDLRIMTNIILSPWNYRLKSIFVLWPASYIFK